MNALEKYYNEIEWTNRAIFEMDWKRYTKKFKKVNPELFKVLMNMTPSKVKAVKDEYLRNWIKNLRSENE